MNTNERAARLLHDDRGAVMVMGIFMCSCLVGALWYLAGIGDAILYRERMQEAADAVAFSDAALHARGMNLIVLVNLVMAVILSVRVALRVAKLVLAIAAAVFAGLGITNPGLWAAAPPTAGAAATINSVDNASKSAIDGALNALVKVQDVIALGTPALAHVAAKVSVGSKYGPVIDQVAILEPHLRDLEGLPVEHARPAKLCAEASVVFPKLLGWLMKKAGLELLKPAVLWLNPVMEALVTSNTKYFCDLEAGASQPSTEDKFDDGADARCDDVTSGKEEQRFAEAERAWLDGCAASRVICSSRDPKGLPLAKGQQTGFPSGPNAKTKEELDRLRLERDQDARSVADLERQLPDFLMNKDKCKAWAKADMKERQKEQRAQDNNQQNNQSSSTSSGTSGIAPMAVNAEFKNGNEEGQIIGAVSGNHGRLQKSAAIVRIGAFHHEKTQMPLDPESGKMPAWAQAEMFYDCGGKWTGKDCNDDDDAMWHFKWRARLRRVNKPTDSTVRSLSLELLQLPPRTPQDQWADRVAQAAVAPMSAGERKANGALRHDLANLTNDPTTHAQGVH
jgi:hypothetical protein